MPATRKIMGVGRKQITNIVSSDNFYTTTGTVGGDNILTGSLANTATTWTADLSSIAGGNPNPAGGWLSGSFTSGATFNKVTPTTDTARVGIGVLTTVNPSEALHLNGRIYLTNQSAPSDTYGKLYSNNGNLHFGGNRLVSGAAGNDKELLYNNSGDFAGIPTLLYTGSNLRLTDADFEMYPNVAAVTLFLSGTLAVSGTSKFRPTGAGHNTADFYSPIADGSNGAVELRFYPDSGDNNNPYMVASGNRFGWGARDGEHVAVPTNEHLVYDYSSDELWVGGKLRFDAPEYLISSSGDSLKFTAADDKIEFVSGTTSFLTFEKHGTQATEIYSDVTNAYLRFREPVQLRSNNNRPYIEFLSQSAAADTGKIREVSGDLHISGASDLILDANSIYLHDDATSRGQIKLTSSLEIESAADTAIVLDSSKGIVMEHNGGLNVQPSNTADSGAGIFNWGGGAYRPGFVNFPFYGEGGTFPYATHTLEINSSGTLYIGNYLESQYNASSSARAFEAGSPQLYISGTALVSGSVRLPSAQDVTSSPGANYLWASGTNLYWNTQKLDTAADGNFYVTGALYDTTTGQLTIEQTGASNVVVDTPNTTSGSSYAIAAYVPSKSGWVSGNANWTLQGANMTGSTLKMADKIEDLTTATTHFAFGNSTHITAVGGGGTSAQFHNGAIGILAQSSAPTVANLVGQGGMLWASGTFSDAGVLSQAKPYWIDSSGNTYDLTETGSSGGGATFWSLKASTSNIHYTSGNVGIITDDPQAPLHVSGNVILGSGASGVLDRVNIGDTTKGIYGYNNRLDFYVASNPRAHIDSSTFYSATSGGPSLDLTPGPAGTANYGFVGDTNTGMTRSAADTLHLLTAGVSGMTMNATQGVGLLTESIDTRQGQGLVISGTNITDTWSDTDTKRKPTSLFLPSLTSGAYVLAGIGGKTSLMASQRAEPPYMIIGAAEQTLLHNNAMNSGRAVSLVLAGTAGYNSGGTDYGNFGSLIFHGNSNWSGNARRWLLSNAFRNSGAGDMGLGFAGGDSSAALDPTVSGSTPSVVMSTDSNYGVAGKGGLLVGNTTHINSGKVTIRDADNEKPLTLAYDGSNYTTFKVNSGGKLTIDTGNDIDLDTYTGVNNFLYRGTEKFRITAGASSPVAFQPKADAYDMAFNQYDGNEVMRITDGQKVGIGTPEPPEKLYVSGGRIGSFETNREILVDPYVAVGGDNQYSGILGQEGLMLATPGDSYLDLWVPDGRYVSFRSATGSTSDNSTTFISGTRANSEYIYFKPTGTAYNKSAYVYARNELQLAAASNMSFNAAGSLTIHIDDDMSIYNPGGNSNLTIRQNSTAFYELQADDDFVWKTANTNTKMILTSGGRLGINTTAPGSQLHVSGTGAFNNTDGIRLGNTTDYASLFANNSHGGLTIDSPHSMVLDCGRHMEFHAGGTTREHRYMYASTQYGFMTTADANSYWAIGNKSAAASGLLLSGAAGGIRMVPADGNVTVVGTISATAKSFDIPHPDKEGMRLVHGSLEGPEHGVYVRGTAKGHGETTIELPDYWKTLVGDDYTLQLTSYNSSNVYIVDKKEDSFTVDSNALTYKFDYVVIGRREEIEVEQDGN